jgi:hypothetical protein
MKANEPLLIDVFLDPSFFNDLAKYNGEVIEAWDRATANGEICYWFNPREMKKVQMSKWYPYLSPLNNDPKFCLVDYFNNYPTLCVIATLYSDRLNVCIEDVCCGPGKLAFYLSKLGFTNFSMIDNFSQMPKQLLDETLRGIPFLLNKPIEEVNPAVVVQSAYPWKVRELGEPELVCTYRHTALEQAITDELQQRGNYQKLCRDSDELMLFHCRSDKVEEYRSKLAKVTVAG